MEVATLFALAVAFLVSGVSVTMAIADIVDPQGERGAAGELVDVRIG